MNEKQFGTILGHCKVDQRSDINSVAPPPTRSGRKSRYPFPLKNIPDRVLGDRHDSRQWLNAKAAAEYIGTSVGSLRNMVWRQQLSAYKPFGYLLFKKTEIDCLIEASQIRQQYEKG